VKFVILGSSPGLPAVDRNLSSIYVQTGNLHILADCGEGTAQKMLRHKLDKDIIDAIYLTHYHPDHIAGVYMVLQMIYLQGRTKPLKLFLPERIGEFLSTLSLFYTFPERFGFALEVYPMEEAGRHYDAVIPVLNDHLLGYESHIRDENLPNTMQAYSLRIEEDGACLVYTSDIQTTKSIDSILAGAHSVIIDALHPDYRQIIRLRDHGVQRIILTHGISDQMTEWLNLADDQRFEYANEDHEYRI